MSSPPRRKRPVGERLAAWALGATYGIEGVRFRSPEPVLAVTEGDRVRVTFDHADGLRLTNSVASGFEIAGADGVFYPASVLIEVTSVVLSSEIVKVPQAIRYAWADDAPGTLFSDAGLPAMPFRTGVWLELQQGFAGDGGAADRMTPSDSDR